MRKNDVRKWIHATLDMLPLLIIPIFALYTTNKNAVFDQSVTVGTMEPHLMPQYIYNGLPNADDYIATNYYDFEVSNGEAIWHCIPSYEEDGDWFGEDAEIRFSGYGSFNLEDVYFCTFDVKYSGTYLDNYSSSVGFNARYDASNVNRYRSIGNLDIDYYLDTDYVTFNSIFTCNRNDLIDVEPNLRFIFNYAFIFENSTDYVDIYLKNIMLINLTTIYGSGNEPSDVDVFLNDFSRPYYDYESYYYVPSPDYVVYDDTDIGSQLTYTLYNTVDKYFNFNNVFNFNQIWNWLQVNIFGGNPPLGAWIVWNVFLYEFLMDLIFLLYALFMFFIDFCSNLIDRFYTTASGGRRK